MIRGHGSVMGMKAAMSRQRIAANGSRRRRVTRNAVASPMALLRASRAAAARPHPRFAWYGGLVLMAAFEIIEWPLAVVMMVGHEIAHRADSRALHDFAEGVEAGV
jgi:hypothetical protein